MRAGYLALWTNPSHGPMVMIQDHQQLGRDLDRTGARYPENGRVSLHPFSCVSPGTQVRN